MSTSNAVTVYRPGALASNTFGDKMSLIKQIIAPGASDLELDLFAEYCVRTGLDPIAKQIYAIKRQRWNNQRRQMEDAPITIQVGIDGARLIAERSGAYAGQLGPYWCGSDKVWLDVWLDDAPPLAAKVGILRKDFLEPLWGVARFESYAQRVKGGQNIGELINLWKSMPEVMIAKCAESLAIRKAFPQQMSGIYTTEEMGQADMPAPEPFVAHVDYRDKNGAKRSANIEARDPNANRQPPEPAIPAKQVRPAQQPRQNDQTMRAKVVPEGVRRDGARINEDHIHTLPVEPEVIDVRPIETSNGEQFAVTPDGEIVDPPDASDNSGEIGEELTPETLKRLWTVARANAWDDESVHRVIAEKYPQALNPEGKISSRYLTESEALALIRYFDMGDDTPKN